PEEGSRPRVFNQVGEVHTVRDLAQMISDKTGTDINFQSNPRKELAENKLLVSNQGLRSLGFEPITLEDGLMGEIEKTVVAYKDRIDTTVIDSKARW
ncbi:MAG: NAD-dependent dehydratase, partial [Pseudomonadota bacterium]